MSHIDGRSASFSCGEQAKAESCPVVTPSDGTVDSVLLFEKPGTAPPPIFP
jgi:hypothetical protein